MIARGVRIEGAGAAATIIDAGRGGQGVVVDHQDVTLANLTVRNGLTTSEGGAVRCVDGTIRLLGETTGLEAQRALAE